MRFRLRPNGGYKQHHIAGTTIPEGGREAVVESTLSEFLEDKPGEPLRLSTRAYEHFKGEFGKGLIAEPVEGGTTAEHAERISYLEGRVRDQEIELKRRDQYIAELERKVDEHHAEIVKQRDLLAGASTAIAAAEKEMGKSRGKKAPAATE